MSVINLKKEKEVFKELNTIHNKLPKTVKSNEEELAKSIIKQEKNF